MDISTRDYRFPAGIARYNVVSAVYVLLAALSELVCSPWINREGALPWGGLRANGLLVNEIVALERIKWGSFINWLVGKS